MRGIVIRDLCNDRSHTRRLEHFELLRAGSVDAVLDDTPANRRRARGGLRLASPDVGHVRYGIAIPEGRDSLYFGIRGALALVQEDGRFRRLQDRWGLREAHMITLS